VIYFSIVVVLQYDKYKQQGLLQFLLMPLLETQVGLRFSSFRCRRAGQWMEFHMSSHSLSILL
jgi:hypothetical protein